MKVSMLHRKASSHVECCGTKQLYLGPEDICNYLVQASVLTDKYMYIIYIYAV